ncbi:NADP-dependent oxidoreductase [Dactylosporangium sp. AC04546]|uniref:NADP-dependent oxidoreductase n=1 Tax=Dactylosporangium sp. AC04546 TaxID=2862460 RepID=UPI001EDD9C20|nr:NADP-dependent oxidoreductase [Dactylosporangium sp. AC04546]WVK84263.1 NADP-dependent oxidoreductase [Dactylosporangium sp. AC04546]
MQAIRYHRHGDASELRLDEVARPVPGAGQVLVRVAATAFNPVDATIRAGYLRQVFPVAVPYTPGIEVAGTVEELGEGVAGFEAGDRVVGLLPMTEQGAAAEYVLVPAESLATAPTAVPLADAAALPATGLTAWQAVHDHAAVKPGQRVLVNGAGGAVGSYAVQLAVEAGATVVATAGERNADRVRGYGAEVPGRTTDDVAGPFDVVLHFVPVPPEAMAPLAALVGDGGVLISTTAPAVGDDGRGVRAANMYVRADAGQLAGLVERVDAGKLHIHVADRVPLGELEAVHARSDAGTLVGKTVITI